MGFLTEMKNYAPWILHLSIFVQNLSSYERYFGLNLDNCLS